MIPTKNTLIYLASLYSLESTPKIRKERYERVQTLMAEMLIDGFIVFSPISYNHPIAKKFHLSAGWEFWKPIDSCYINKCDSMLILKDEGWERSVGITAEIKIAKKLRKEIGFVHFERDGLGRNTYCFEKFN